MLVLSSVIDQIAIITLNRPERHNSLIPPVLEEFSAAVTAAGENDKLRAVVIQANGRSFSTGGDMKGFYENLDDLEQYASELVGLLNEAILNIIELPQPSVAAVQGAVTGGALGLVVACDLVIVAQSAFFAPYYTEVGFSPDGGWASLLPDIIGPKRTAKVLIENQMISANQAVSWGLADRIVPSGRLREEALSTARSIAGRKAGAIRRARQLLTNRELSQRLEEERSLFVKQIATTEAREGILAFNRRRH